MPVLRNRHLHDAFPSFGGPGEGVVARPASGFLRRQAFLAHHGRAVDGAAVAVHAVMPAEILDEPAVLPGVFAAEHMIHMNDRKREVSFLLLHQIENMKETQRIRAAGET